MAKPWGVVEKSEAYQRLAPKDQLAAKQQYWDIVVTKKEGYTGLSGDDKELAKTEFFGGKQPSKSPMQDLYSLWGANITPEMREKSPYLMAIAKTAQEGLGTPFLHFLNQAGINYPRYMAEQQGYTYPESETGAGQMLAGGAGMAGAIASPLTRAIIGLGGVGKIPTSMGLGEKVLRGAGTGAAIAGAYAQPMAQRPWSAMGGGALGAITPLIGASIKGGVKAFRKFKAPSKAPIEKRISWQKADTRKQASEKIRILREGNTEAQKVIKDNIQILDQDLQKSTQQGSLEFKKRLPEFFRNNSEAYGQRLQEITDDLAESGNYIQRGEARAILDNAVKEASDAELFSGLDKLDDLKMKYRIDPGNDLFADDAINFKEFNSDLRKIFNSLYSQFEKGKVKFKETDVIVNILKKNYGEWVAKRVPDFGELQTNYKPVVQAMKESGRIFKPYTGDFTTTRGASVLRKIAVGKASPQEQDLIKFLERGKDEFTEGIGGVSKKSQQIGQRLLKTKELQQTTQYGHKTATQKIQAGIQPRLQQLTERERKVITLLANKKKAQMIRKILLGYGGIGGIGAYLLRRKIGEAVSDK